MIGIISDVGIVRSLNEDFASYFESEKFCIYVVADGMGGHNAGEVASKMATEKIVEYVKKNFDILNKDEVLKDAIKEANQCIYKNSIENENFSGMGTTITACLKYKDIIYVANVGDSSCFGIKGNVIKKITKDHSLVQELVDLGTISEQEAANHPKKNIITRAVGTNLNVEVDIFKLKQGDYDLYILCSDGLTNEVTKEEILSIVQEEKEPSDTCKRLVNLAKYKGGRDNVTVLLFGGDAI